MCNGGASAGQEARRTTNPPRFLFSCASYFPFSGLLVGKFFGGREYAAGEGTCRDRHVLSYDFHRLERDTTRCLTGGSSGRGRHHADDVEVEWAEDDNIPDHQRPRSARAGTGG